MINFFFKMDNENRIEFSLNIDSIKEVPFEKYSNDFVFIVDGKEYYTNRIIADILSPIIRQYHYFDETNNRFYINTINKNTKIDFSSIFSLINFQSITINQEELEWYLDIFSSLGNQKEFLKLIPYYPKEITTNNVIKRIQEKRIFLQNFNSKSSSQKVNFESEDVPEIAEKEYIQPELDFISNHFFEIGFDELQKLDPFIIEDIIKSDKLKLEDEDSLLNLINDLYSKNSKFSYLYEYVDFLNVSNEGLCHFFDIFDLNDINRYIWKSVIKRTMKPQHSEIEPKTTSDQIRTEKVPSSQISNKPTNKKDKANDKHSNIIEIEAQLNSSINKSNQHEKAEKTRNKSSIEKVDNNETKEPNLSLNTKESKENSKTVNSTEKVKNNIFSLLHKDKEDFNGIITYLTAKTGGNIHDNGTIAVSSNSYFSPPKYLLDFNCDAYYQAGKADAWVLFDFKELKVKITSYSIMSNSGGENLYHLKSWDLEVSNDGVNWTKIDERRDHPKLNGSYATGTFEVRPNDYSRYVRIHQIDDPWGGGYLWFYYMEFYGYLKEE